MIAQKTNKQRWAGRPLAGVLAALLLLAMLVAGNAAATSPGEAALNAPPTIAASHGHIEARNSPARCRLCRPQPIPPP